MGGYRQLRVWQLGIQLVEEIHGLTDTWRRSGSGELKAQMKRAAISIVSNIAEGADRGSRGDFRRFLAIALGSCGELATHLEIAKRLRYVEVAQSLALADRIDHEGRMLRKLIQHLQ